MGKEPENMLIAKQVNPPAMSLAVPGDLLNLKAAISLSVPEAEFHRPDRITLYKALKTFEGKGICTNWNKECN